jgi:hypothetical protein
MTEFRLETISLNRLPPSSQRALVSFGMRAFLVLREPVSRRTYYSTRPAKLRLTALN